MQSLHRPEAVSNGMKSHNIDALMANLLAGLEGLVVIMSNSIHASGCIYTSQNNAGTHTKYIEYYSLKYLLSMPEA